MTRVRFAAAAAAVFLLAAATAAGAEDTARVNKGIFAGGIDCSGMTEEEVRTAINGKISELGQKSVSLTIGDQTASCTLSDLGLFWSNKEIVSEMMQLGATGNIVQRYKDQKDLEHDNKQYVLTYDLKDETVSAYAQGFSSYNTEPVNATIFTQDDLTPGVEGGTDGITVDIEGSIQALESMVQGWDGSSDLSVTLPTERVAPEIPYDTLACVSDVLGTATTDYSASSSSRAINVENGCRKISGTLLWPGEEFSVTAAVTPFTADNGYEQAPSYEENRVVDSYGGGICQVSTTLYNAVLKSELQVTSRSNHTMAVSYVALSKDAAIAEGVMDMAFINTKDDPIYIIGYTYGGTITFTIFGHETRPANRTIEFESITTQTIEPTDSKMFANTAQQVGYINQTQSPHTGYTAELWKHIYVDGILQESVQINSSYYNAVGTIYDIGVASASPAVTQAMYQAIATNSLANVQQTIASAAAIAQQQQQQQQQQQTDAAGNPVAPQTDANGNPVVPPIDVYGDVDESMMGG